MSNAGKSFPSLTFRPGEFPSRRCACCGQGAEAGALKPYLLCDDGSVIEVPVDANGNPIPGYVDAEGRYVPIQ